MKITPIIEIDYNGEPYLFIIYSIKIDKCVYFSVHLYKVVPNLVGAHFQLQWLKYFYVSKLDDVPSTIEAKIKASFLSSIGKWS